MNTKINTPKNKKYSVQNRLSLDDLSQDLKAVILDFDGTISPGPVGGYLPFKDLKIRFCLTKNQIRKAKKFEKENIKKYFLFREDNLIKDLEQEKKIHLKFYENMGLEIGLREYKKFSEFLTKRRFKAEFALFDDVEDFLNEIKGKFKLGMITEGLPSRVSECKRLGFFKKFESILISHSLGISKNDPEIYLLACSRLGVKPFEAVMIDDSLSFLKIAQSVGLNVVYLDRSHMQSQDNFPSVETLHSLPL